VTAPSEDLGKLRSKSADGRCRRLLRLKPAAEYLSISIWTLRAMIQRGELPVIKPSENAPWLVDLNDLDAWIDRRKEAC
jgi:excisionase family DNA binding protein